MCSLCGMIFLTNNYLSALIQPVAETTPKESTQESPSAQERLSQLEKKLITTTDWTEEDRQEILGLRELFSKSPKITEKHRDAFRRQNIADLYNNPPLSDEERRLIRETNSV